jgi:tetratricopeptide (TPR) repeat protein
MSDDATQILAQARAALKAGEAHAAVRAYRQAQKLLPRDPEIPHERGLAHLEAGDVGLAAFAQGEALAIDPDHMGARAQRAASLEALGDDDGAARELDELLKRIGPNLPLQARSLGLRESARRAQERRLIGNDVARLAMSPVATSLARSIGEPLFFKAPFAELRGHAEGARLARLDLVFESMDSSMGRSDLTYGGATQDEDGRRVPLDEFTAAGIVFLSEALGIETLRARRMLSFLLTPECGLGPHRFAGCNVGWTVSGDDGQRRYGLFCETCT